MVGIQHADQVQANCRWNLTLASRIKETDEVFFVQNAGAKNASTGLNKSAIIEKISLAEAAAVSHKSDAAGLVNVTTVPSSPTVLNPNGRQSALFCIGSRHLTVLQVVPITVDKLYSPVRVKVTMNRLLCGL